MRFILILAGCLLLAHPSFAQTGKKNPWAGQTQKKNPWVALGLSFLVPGAGQLYNDQPHKGIFMFAGSLTGYLAIHYAFEDNGEHCTATFNDRTYTRADFSACADWLAVRRDSFTGSNVRWQMNATTNHDYDDDDGNATMGAWIYLGAWAWSMIDATRTANRINAEALSQSALEIAPIVTPGGAGARVVMRF